MNCKFYRTRTKKGIKYGYCTKFRKNVPLFCKNCGNSIEYKQIKIKQSSNKNSLIYKGNNIPIKKKSNKLAMTEKNRFSIIYSDLTKCCVDGCLTPYNQVEKNEVFEGAYRQMSIKYGMVCPFCKYHHDLFHSDRLFALNYKVLFQDVFVKIHSKNLFMKTFKQDYKYLLKALKNKV